LKGGDGSLIIGKALAGLPQVIAGMKIKMKDKYTKEMFR
jgi:hypothetical protein